MGYWKVFCFGQQKVRFSISVFLGTKMYQFENRKLCIALKPLNQAKNLLVWFFDPKCLRIFRQNGAEFRIFNINSLLRSAKTNISAKVDIEV